MVPKTTASNTTALRLLALVAFVAGVLTHIPAPAQATRNTAQTSQSSDRCVAIYSTSDMHGAIKPRVRKANNHQVRYGGMLALSGYLRALRMQHGDRMLLLDAGDLYQGSLASNVSKGKAVIAGYNTMGYDAIAVGNHEFDFGPILPNDADLLGVLKQRASEAKFPWLAINIDDKRKRRSVTWNNTHHSIILSVAGIKVGLIGVSNPDTPRVTLPTHVASLQFKDPVPLVAKEASKLRAQGAQLIVVLAHMGSSCSNLSDPYDATSCNSDSDMFRFLDALKPGTVDVAVGGHSHTLTAHWQGRTAVIQGGAYGHYLAGVDACLQSDGSGIDVKASQIKKPIPICLDTWAEGGCGPRERSRGTQPATFAGVQIKPDPVLEATLKPYLAEVDAVGKRPVATLPYPLTREHLPQHESLGGLVAEAMRQSVDADVAIQNRGGVRKDLDAGLVTYGALFEILPFENRVVTVTMTGTQLQAMVTHLTARRHGQPPYVGGMRLQAQKDGGMQIVTTKGSPVSPKNAYKVATNDYLVRGGEGLQTVFADIPAKARKTHAVAVRKTFVEYMRSNFPLKNQDFPVAAP